MDFGDIIYIIVLLGFSAIGAIRKRKKQQPVQTTSKPGNFFEDLFEQESGVDDPIEAQSQRDLENDESDFLESEEVEETVAEAPQRSHSAYNKIKEQPVAAQKNVKKKSGVNLDLGNANELRRAVIYSEILKPKF